jgi:hypothetical protein
MLRNLTATDTAYLKSTAAAMIQEVFLIGQKFVLMMNATECTHTLHQLYGESVVGFDGSARPTAWANMTGDFIECIQKLTGDPNASMGLALKGFKRSANGTETGRGAAFAVLAFESTAGELRVVCFVTLPHPTSDISAVIGSGAARGAVAHRTKNLAYFAAACFYNHLHNDHVPSFTSAETAFAGMSMKSAYELGTYTLSGDATACIGTSLLFIT